jgi:hypothetical protein
VLVGFPIGLAVAAGGLKEQAGLYFPARVVAAGGLLLLLALLWRGGRPARPSKPLVAVAVIAAISLFVAPSLLWVWDTKGTDWFEWPLEVGLVIAAVVAAGSAVLGLWRGGRAWAVLLASVGGTAMLAAVAIGNVAAVHDTDTNSGPWLALVAGLALAGAGVYALLRPAPPPGPR